MSPLVRPLLSLLAGAGAWLGPWDGAVVLALLFPAVWAGASSRAAGAACAAAYFGGAALPLAPGASTFFHSAALGAGIYGAAVAVLTAPYVMFWSARRPVVGVLVATVVSAIPPVAICGFVQPLLACSVLFPGWGVIGLVASLATIAGVTALGHRPCSRRLQVAAIATIGLAIVAACDGRALPSRNDPAPWRGIDTTFGDHQDDYQQLTRIRAILWTVGKDESVLLPEAVIGDPDVVRSFLATELDTLRARHAHVYAGATVVTPNGPRNRVVEIVGGATIAESRIPPPGSMWRPWAPASSYPLRLMDDGITTVDGRRVATLVCYEALLIWPGALSALGRPQVLLVPANDWFDSGAIQAIQRRSARLWSRLLNAPLVMAVNTGPP